MNSSYDLITYSIYVKPNSNIHTEQIEKLKSIFNIGDSMNYIKNQLSNGIEYLLIENVDSSKKDELSIKLDEINIDYEIKETIWDVFPKR